MADIEKPELMGPDAIGHWLNVLRKNELPQREYLSLTEAATQLGCAPGYLLDEGVSGNLNLYAPILHEGLYIWPVTDHGISRLPGHIGHVRPGNSADVQAVFRARFQYGELLRLSAMSLKKIKIEKSVQPDGYLYPELVLLRISEWEKEHENSQVTKFTARMKSLASKIAWTSAYPEETRSGKIDMDMLHVDANDLPRLQAQHSRIDNTESPLNTVQRDSNQLPIKIEDNRNTYNTSIQILTAVLQVDANHLPALAKRPSPLSTPDQSQSRQKIEENIGSDEDNSASTKPKSHTHTIKTDSPTKNNIRINTGKPGRRPGIWKEITLAQTEAEQIGADPNSPTDIWGILTKHAEEKSPHYPRFKGWNRNGIQYNGENGEMTYSFRALARFLSPK